MQWNSNSAIFFSKELNKKNHEFIQAKVLFSVWKWGINLYMLVKKNYHRYSFFKAIKNYINYILVMPVFMYIFINIFIMPTSHGSNGWLTQTIINF